MRSVKIRFSEPLWALIRAEAEREGISPSQFVRDAAMARGIYLQTQRGELEDVEAIVRRIRESE